MSEPITKIPNDSPATVVRLSHFKIGSHTLHHAHLPFLRSEVIPVLDKGGSILLMGMASRSGSAATNQALSQRRTDEVLRNLRTLTKVNFKVVVNTGVGELAAQAENVRDGNEDPYWRAVQIVYWDKPEPPPLPAPPTTQRISLRRTTLDKSIKKPFTEIYGPGEKGDKAAKASEAIMYGPKQRNVDTVIQNAKESLIAEQTIATNPDFVLVRVMIHRLIIQRLPQLSPFPDRNLEMDFGGTTEMIRREFFYARGGIQKVTVIETIKVKNPDGSITDKGINTILIDPPASLNF